MHKCLTVFEIVSGVADAVVGEVDWTHGYTNGPSYNEREGCASLARTCRAFYEPAMDAPWRHLPSLKPIISNLPQRNLSNGMVSFLNLLAEYRVIYLIMERLHFQVFGPLDQSNRQVARFCTNLRRIRSLYLCHVDNGGSQFSDELKTLTICCATLGESLVPNLHTLALSGITPAASPFIPLLLHEGLHSCIFPPDELEHRLTFALLGQLHRLVPRLQRIVSRNRKTPVSALKMAASFKDSRFLKFVATNCNTEDLVGLIRSLPEETLEDLRMTISHGPLHTPPWNLILSAIGRLTSIRYLRLEVDYIYWRIAPSMYDMRPLLSLVFLETLHLSIAGDAALGASSLDDQSITEFPHSFPQLRSLTIRQAEGYSPVEAPQRFSLDVLTSCALHWPRLDHLSVETDLTEVPKMPLLHARSSRKVSLDLSHIATVPKAAWLDVAAYISRVYPNANLTVPAANRVSCRYWRNIVNAVPVFARAREEERTLALRDAAQTSGTDGLRH